MILINAHRLLLVISKSLLMDHGFPNLALPACRSLETVAVSLIIHHGLIDFFLRIEYERAILYHFLIKRKASDNNCGRLMISLGSITGCAQIFGIWLTKLGIFIGIFRHFRHD